MSIPRSSIRYAVLSIIGMMISALVFLAQDQVKQPTTADYPFVFAIPASPLPIPSSTAITRPGKWRFEMYRQHMII